MKSLAKLKEEISRVYGSDFKLIPNGPGKPMRKVRARAIVFNKAPGPEDQIQAAQVGDSQNQDKDKGIELYTKYYRKYLKALKQNEEYEPSNIQESKDQEPPFVLVLKRINYKVFPDNVKVALYHNEKLDKYFTVPFNRGGLQMEEVEINNERELISNFLQVYSNLSEENQIKMLEMINGDNDSYEKIKNFTLETK